MKLLIYDSGVGGAVVYERLRQRAANLSDAITKNLEIEFFADHEHFPYGRKQEFELKNIVESNLERFFDQGYDCVGIACNTASIIARKYGLSRSRPVFTILEPTVQKVLEHNLQPVHIIASQFTVSTREYSTQLHAVQPNWQITESAEQRLIEAVEAGDIEQEKTEVARIVSQLEPSVQSLVLGCTHFSKIKHVFVSYCDEWEKTCQIIDSAEVLVDVLEQYLTE